MILDQLTLNTLFVDAVGVRENVTPAPVSIFPVLTEASPGSVVTNASLSTEGRSTDSQTGNRTRTCQTGNRTPTCLCHVTSRSRG